jgi:hypothetical protein
MFKMMEDGIARAAGEWNQGPKNNKAAGSAEGESRPKKEPELCTCDTQDQPHMYAYDCSCY